jgi:hypothetical protein
VGVLEVRVNKEDPLGTRLDPLIFDQQAWDVAEVSGKKR